MIADDPIELRSLEIDNIDPCSASRLKTSAMHQRAFGLT
jgi:hypothetical protein